MTFTIQRAGDFADRICQTSNLLLVNLPPYMGNWGMVMMSSPVANSNHYHSNPRGYDFEFDTLDSYQDNKDDLHIMRNEW